MRPATEQLKKPANRIWFYVTPATRQKIEEAAAADDRTVSNFLRHFLGQSFEESSGGSRRPDGAGRIGKPASRQV